jgi:hypothetical protein
VLTDYLAAHINDVAVNMKGLEMQSTIGIVRRSSSAPRTINRLARTVAIALAGCAILINPAAALPMTSSALLQQQLNQHNPVIEVVVRHGGTARRTTVIGPRGNAASRTVVHRGAVVRPGVARNARWVRPANYYWRPGGAIAAGAAIGFVAAASAAAWAGAPPAAGYCWYYTDPSKTQGFWDACP